MTMTKLVILVADKDAEVTVRILLTERDPGVFSSGSKLIITLKSQFSHALTVLDQEWDGTPGNSVVIKELLDAIVLETKNQKHHTSGTFAQIAKKISLTSGIDSAFNEMKSWLQGIYTHA